MERLEEKVVSVNSRVSSKLAEIFGCSQRFANMALSGESSTEKAKKIRYTAVKEFGGKVVEWVLPRGCEEVGVMIHDHVHNRRIVNMGRGYYLITYLDRGCVNLENRNGTLKSWSLEGMTIHDYESITKEAKELIIKH